jgi:hypothetical protein
MSVGIIMAGIDRQGVVSLNGTVGQHVPMYEYVPVGQNTWRSKHCVGQHYIGQSTPKNQLFRRINRALPRPEFAS